MTQPRRIAAKSVAGAHRRRNEEAASAGLVGWQVRFTDQGLQGKRASRLMYRRHPAGGNPVRPGVSALRHSLILDEAHERSLNIDFLLGYLKTPAARGGPI